MSKLTEYFYFDYLLYQNISDFLAKRNVKFDVAKLLSENFPSIDEELECKLCINKILSIFTTLECKNLPVCCKFDFENKLTRCIAILSDFENKKMESLTNFLVIALLIVTRNKKAFTNKGFRNFEKEFYKKMRKLLWSRCFKDERKFIYKKKIKSEDVKNEGKLEEHQIFSEKNSELKEKELESANIEELERIKNLALGQSSELKLESTNNQKMETNSGCLENNDTSDQKNSAESNEKVYSTKETDNLREDLSKSPRALSLELPSYDEMVELAQNESGQSEKLKDIDKKLEAIEKELKLTEKENEEQNESKENLFTNNKAESFLSNNEKLRKRTFKGKFISTELKIGTEVYSRLFMKRLRHEVRQVFNTFDEPFLATFTAEGIQKLKRNKMRENKGGKEVNWSDESIAE